MSDYESSILQELTSIGQATGSAAPVDPVVGNEQIAAAPSPDDYEASIFKELSGLNPSAGAVAPTPKKQVDIAPDALSSLVIAAQRGVGANRDLEKDLITLEDADLVKIYGQGTDALRDQMYNELKAQQKTLEADRGVAQIMGDSINKGVQSAIGFIGGGLSLSAGAGNYVGSKINDGLGIEDNVMTNFADQVAPAISEATNAAVGWLNGFTSDQTQETDRLVALQTNYETGVNKAERDAAVAAGGNSVVETMRMVGKDFLDGGAEILDNPTATSNLIAGALGSAGPSAKVVGSVAKMVESTGTYKAAQLAAAIDSTGMGKILGLAANATKAGATAGAVGLTEAAGTYQQTMQEVLDMPEEDLLRSAEYFHLVENGMDPGKARTQVAERTAREAFFTALPLATATSIMALKFDANPLKAMGDAGFQDGLAGIGREVLGQTVEEALQGGSSEYSRNLAFQDNINPAQELFTGVGEQAAAGAIGGAGMAGVLGIPGAAGVVGNLAADNLAGPAGPSAPTPFGPNDPNSPSDLDPGMSDALLNKAQSDIAKMEAQTGPLTEYQQEVLRVLRSNQDNPDNLYKLYVPNDRSPAAEKAFNESLNDITPSALSTFVETAKVKAGQAAAVAKDLYSKASAGAQEGFAKAKEAVAEKANEYNNKQTPEASAATVQAATNSVVAVYDWNTQTGQDAPEGIKQATALKAEDVPTELQDTLSSAPDVVSTVSSLVQNLTTGAIKVKDLSNDGLLYAHDHIEKLRAALPTMPKDVQESVKAMLNSPSVAKIQARVKGLDLSTKVGNSVSALKRMVRVNPTKVNPAEVAKILEQRDRTDLTDEDVRLLSSAAKIASALDNHAGNKVQIGKDEIVDFTKPVNTPILDNQNARVSRNLQVEGFNGLRSINDYASDIFRAAQSADPSAAIGLDGKVYSGKSLAAQYANFVQHMINKVGALNQSHDAGGTNVQFESLNAKSGRMVPAGQVGGAKSVAHHPGNPGSTKNAQAIYNDAKAAVEVYNTLVETFPEMFPEGKKTLSDLKVTSSKAEETQNSKEVVFGNPFKDSVLQEVVYHASNDPNFSIKDIKTIRPNDGANGSSVWLKGSLGSSNNIKVGFYVTPDVIYGAAMAGATMPLGTTDLSTVSKEDMNGVVVHKLYVNITKPYYPVENDPITPTSISLEQMENLKREGFDGIIDGQDIIVFDKNQVAEAEPKPAQPEAKPKVEAEAVGAGKILYDTDRYPIGFRDRDAGYEILAPGIEIVTKVMINGDGSVDPSILKVMQKGGRITVLFNGDRRVIISMEPEKGLTVVLEGKVNNTGRRSTQQFSYRPSKDTPFDPKAVRSSHESGDYRIEDLVQTNLPKKLAKALIQAHEELKKPDGNLTILQADIMYEGMGINTYAFMLAKSERNLPEKYRKESDNKIFDLLRQRVKVTGLENAGREVILMVDGEVVQTNELNTLERKEFEDTLIALGYGKLVDVLKPRLKEIRVIYDNEDIAVGAYDYTGEILYIAHATLQDFLYKKTPQAVHVVLHELSHALDMVDNHPGLYSESEEFNGKDSVINKEITELLKNKEHQITVFLQGYALTVSKENNDRAHEVFAELSSMYLDQYANEILKEELPNVYAFFEARYQDVKGDFSGQSQDGQESNASEETIVQEVERKATAEETDQILDLFKKAYGDLKFPKLPIVITDVIDGKENRLGQMGHDGTMKLVPAVFENKDNMKKATHIVFHELGHWVNNYGEYPVSDSRDWDKAVAEFDAFVDNVANETQKRFLSYILSHRGKDTYGSEVFADLFSIMGTRPDFVSKNFPLAQKLMTEALNEATGNPAKPNENQDKQTVSPDTTEDVSTRVETPEVAERNSLFTKVFSKAKEPAQFNSVDDIVAQVNELGEHMGVFTGFLKANVAAIQKRLNARLSSIKFDDKKSDTVLEALRKDPEKVLLYRDFKNLAFVDSTTGLYDPTIASLAISLVLDELSGAHPAPPSLLRDRMTEDGVSFASLAAMGKKGEQLLKDYMQSISIRQISENLARDLPTVLGLQINDEARLGDARGALEDLIKEILVSVAETNDGGLLRIADVPTSEGVTQAIVLSETMKNLQISMGLDGRSGMSKLLFPENISGPSLNAPPEFVAQKQTRGGIETSTAEREVLKNMQSIGHSRTPVADLLKALGPDVMFTLLGGKDVSHLADNHPLRRSIEGKNLSIERDYQDALEIAQALEDAGVDSKVYYPVGISRVGRHQMQGPNPQNNKILRHSVTSTVSVLDMRNNPTHQDYFWLTVAQAAGMAKAEKKNHDLILSTIEGDFRGRYRDAIYLAREFLITGEIDSAAFDLAIRGINGIPENSIVPAGTKVVEYEATMAVIDAVMAVAALDEARADGTENEFTTTLSFEIDGLTDGPGNMLVNMGQGLLTLNDYENLRRVGYFLGERNMTTNAYYNQQGNKDFYEMTTQFAEASMALDKSGALQMQALTRFAARFGDFEIERSPDGRMAYKMTRNTAKSPVTKKGYGSGTGGIARGIAEDMVLEFYRYMTEDSNGNPAEERNYPEFVEDFLILFSSEFIEGTPWDRSFFDKASVARFTTMVEYTLGRILTEAAEKMLGSEIQKVNDTLVFMTNIQAVYLQKAFDHRVRAILEARGANPKKQIRYQDLTVGELKQIVSDLKALAPVYYNGVQALGLGAFEGTISESTELSSTMDGRLRMKSTLPLPSDAGVKVIPYLNIGRGDAMMMNVVYGNENFPTRSIPIFDGVSLAIADIGAYSDLINEAVAENWNQDLLEPVLRDLMRFSQSVPANEQRLLQAAYREVAKMQPKSIKFESLEHVGQTLADMVKGNQARKTVFAKIPRSVNHMGGADRAINLGPEGFLDLDQINALIAEEMRNPTPKAEEEPADPKNQFTNLSVMTGMEMLRALLTTVKNRRLLEVLKTLVKANPNVRVVTGNAAQIAAHRLNEGADPVLTTRKGSGFFDEKNQTIYLVSKNHETLVHELIHFTTFALVHKTYAGQGSPAQREAVSRLEKLMGQFMEMDFSKASKAAQRAAKSAKAQILGHQANNDAWSQAAALNEFMAWSLANEALGRELGNTLADGVLRLIKTVKALMARLLGSVSYDMFSNVLFNTRAILEPDLNQEPSAVDPKTNKPAPTAPVGEALTGEVLVDEDAEGDIFGQGGMMIPYGDDGNFGNGGNLIGGNGGSGGKGGNGSSQDPSGMPHYNNFWINLLRTKLNELRPAAVGRTAKTDQFIRYLNNARKAYDRMVQGGFGFTEEQRLTFEAIHMILALEVQLDARALQSMGKVFNHVVENLRPEMFTGEAQDKYQSFMDALGKTTNDEQISDAIATFFAMSQTNDEFRFVLEQLPKPADKKASSFSEFVSMMSISMMRKAVGSINPDDKNARDAMDMLSRVILAQDTKEEFRILRLLMKSFDVADQYTSGKLRQMSDLVSDYAYNVSDEQRMKKKIAESVALVTNLFSDQRAELTYEFVKTITHNGNTFDDFVFLRELVAEMIGTDKNNEKIIALMDVVKKQVSALREGHRDNVPLTLQGNFQTKPTAEQWAVAHAVLAKTDFSALFDLQYADQTMSLISDPAYRARQIKIYSDTIKRELSRSAALAVMDKAQQLADFMNGQGAGFQLLRNAFAINEIEGDKSKPGLVTAIDKLVSLLALDGKDPSDLQTISDMYAADPDAMKSVLVYMKKLNQNEDEKLQVSETILTDEYGDEYDYDPVHRMRMNGYKGYVPNLGNPDVTITVEDDAYRTILEKRGFIRVGDYTADDMVSVFSKGYYVSSTRQNGGYAQGVMQSIQNTYRGVNAGTGITVNGTTSGIIMGYENLDRVISTLNRAGTVADPKETLLPVYDGDSVIYYESALNPDVVEKYTQPDGNLALQLGVWSGRQVEEKAAQSYNALLIDQLKAVWDNREQGSDGLFIDIRAEYYAWMQWERATKEERRTMRKPDAIYADSWKVIPPQTKAYIAGVFGDDGFMVRRDQINTALGYAEPSISDFWTGKTRFSEETASVVRAVANMTLGRLKSGTSALTILQTAAGGLQETVSFAKDLIVTRSLVVPYLNSQANIFTLNLRGVPNKMIVTGYRDKLIEIEQYNQNFKKIMFLNTQYDLAEGDTNKQGIIRREIQVLKDQNRRMSIYPLVEAGAYKNISEGITEEDFDILKTGLASLVEKQVDRLPDIAKTIVRNGLVSQTTDIYRVANKAVQYGDFLAKGVYFDYLTQIQGMKPEEALSRINEEYVNFSTPPGRVRSALDKYGATWFMTYKIRVAKVAMAQARQNPVRALLVNTLDEGGRNTAQHSNLFANMLDGSIEYSLGWEMMMNSPGLNPWLNMLDW